MQGPISIKVGPCEHVVGAKKVSVEARRVLLSHNREKVLGNCILQAKTLHVDCRGLESAIEAVRVSLEAVRVSIEALRCFRGLKRSLRMSIEAVRV